MHVLRTLLRFVVTTVLTAAVLTAGLAVGGVAVHAWRFHVVEVASTQPALRAGDVVLLRPVSADQLRPGQVLALPTPADGSSGLGRVESVSAVAGHLVVRTGDDALGAAPAASRTTAWATMSSAWVVSGRIPFGGIGLGKVLADARLRTLSLEATGGLLFLAALLVALSRRRRRMPVPAQPEKTPFSEEWWRLLARS